MKQELSKCIEIEKANHPWADDATLARIAKDNLKRDPEFYSEEEEYEEEYEEEVEDEGQEMDPNDPLYSVEEGGEDPFPMDDEDGRAPMSQEEMDYKHEQARDRASGGRRNSGKSQRKMKRDSSRSMSQAEMDSKGRDPFPKDED